MSGRIEDFEVIEVIGTGSFGTCYKVRNKISGRIYVWKAIDYGKMTEEKKQLLVSEVNLLSELNHPHIVRYYDRILHRETTTIYIIMEWCQGGDLASLIQRRKQEGSPVEEVFVWRVLYQTGRALQACHSHLRDVTVLHRDIKPANVFLDANGNVKLGDFGLARILHGQQAYSDTIVGTPYYMSPEVIRGSKYDRKSDIWALGCLVYELCALSPPFVGADMQQLATNIREARFDPIPSNFSEDLQKIIELMLSKEHQYRPTIEMILHHPTVVLNISTKNSFKFTSKKDRIKEECEKTALALVSEKMKTLATTRKDPEEITEDIFQEKWMSRLESLRQREANIRKREDKILEKERALGKREKQLLLVERLTKEKLARAEVYLRQCKENRSVQVPTVAKSQKYKLVEDLDTSLSADPGDTSILPTSARINPVVVPLPNNFVRCASERRIRHVHFDMNKRLSNIPEGAIVPKKHHNEAQAVDQNLGPQSFQRKAFQLLQESENAASKKCLTTLERPPLALKSNVLSNQNWVEEKHVWLENKRAAYHSTINKENIENTSHDQKDIKRRSSKLSLFSKKQSFR